MNALANASPSTCRRRRRPARRPRPRGVRRDGVRLLVASRSSGELTHTTFDRIVDFLSPGDLVVVNTSGVIPAAIRATAPDGSAVVVHLSTRLDDGRWVVELRRPDGTATARWTDDVVPLDLALGDNASIHLHEPYSRRAAVDRHRPHACAAVRLAGAPRPADPLRLRRAPVAAVGLPERVRRRTGQRGDAERRPAVQHRGDHPPHRHGRRHRPARAAHRCRLAGVDRAALPGTAAGAGDHGGAGQPHSPPRRSHHRRRHHGGARLGDRRRVRRRSSRTTAGPIW